MMTAGAAINAAELAAEQDILSNPLNDPDRGTILQRPSPTAAPAPVLPGHDAEPEKSYVLGGAAPEAQGAFILTTPAADQLSTTMASGDVSWNNGYRTSDGKFASPTGEGRAGEAAVDNVEAEINSREGWSTVGREISFRDETGQLRRYDIVAKDPDGQYVGIEVKSGSAQMTPAQRAFDDRLNERGATASGVGEKAKDAEVDDICSSELHRCQ